LAVTADLARDDPWGVAINEINLVFALLNAEGPRRAYEQVVQVAAGAVALEDVELSLTVLDSFAAVWAGLGNPERAARVLGASDCQRDRSGIHRNGPDQTHLDRFIVPARRSVAASDWDRSYAAGMSMSVEEALAEGMAAEPSVGSLAGAVNGHT
jgi:hypothetical protein